MLKLIDRPSFLRFPEGDGSGGGGGGSGDGDGDGTGGSGDGDLESKIKAAVEEATAGLRKNRDDVIGEKRDLKKKFDEQNDVIVALGGPDGMKRLQTMMETLQKDELGTLLAEGKTEEWFDKRAGAMKKDYDARMKLIQDKLTEAIKERDESVSSFRTKVLETEVLSACGEAGVVDSAYDDVKAAAGFLFKNDPEHGLCIRDKEGTVVYGKDGKTPLSPLEWLGMQKETKRHWWPPSKGADASSSHGGRATPGEIDLSEVKDLAEWKKIREKMGMKSGVGTGSIL